MTRAIAIEPGALTLARMRRIWLGDTNLVLPAQAHVDMDASAAIVQSIIERGAPAYGINTGFGKLAQTRIPDTDLEQLQENLILSHSVGVGEPLAPAVARLVMALKVNSLARGYSGIRSAVVQTLLDILNAGIIQIGRASCRERVCQYV